MRGVGTRFRSNATRVWSLGLIWLALVLGSPLALSGERPVRIVLITIDTLRYDAFEAPDGQASFMPRMQAAARGAAVFRRHYAATSTTQPTHASILTGLHPWEHGVARNGIKLDDAQNTITERMQASGFYTAAVVASFPLHRTFGYSQGFRDFDDEFTEVRETKHWSQVEVPEGRFRSLATGITAKAVRLLDRAESPKQFFWFHYFDPHSPYGDLAGGEVLSLTKLRKEMRSPDKWQQAVAKISHAKRLYDGDVRALDESLGRLFERILEDRERFETHVVFVADHGESFGESESVGHGTRLTPEQIHVPCFVLSPRVKPGVRDEATGSIDIATTLLSMAGIGDESLRGRDLTRAALADGAVVGMRRTYLESKDEIRTDGKDHRLPDYSFYVEREGRLLKGNREGVVAGDALPVDEQVASQVRSLFEVFERQLRSVEREAVLSDEQRRALEALGYVQ